ncbi:PRC-barrel domain-containing protein [Aurantimonas sp. DM33-3]|uniref:PRC-barrel domain-containing protein n=1 Tax=Aurantimonas sp. DM33-3 TaxID=2766955 RepID=UPI001651F7E0|nr:PRC-barrel domain-containing protein [Aurantimonas sp. DM33-3]MBC6718281.1 PRC-barrel domain-containing protein [Aurantimonas sp. DM33-3]
MKQILAAAALSLIAVPALAQQGAMVEVADQTMVSDFNLTADAVGELDVYTSDGTKIGEVEDVVGPDQNTAQGIAVDFDDNATDYGREDRVIPIDQFSVSESRLVLSADAQTVSSMPTWDD